MVCKKCGTQMEDGEKFCPNCGEKAVQEDEGKTEEVTGTEQAVAAAENTASTANPIPTIPEQTVAGAAMQPGNVQESGAEPKKSGKLPLIIGLAAVGVLALIACVAVFAGVLSSGGKQEALIYLKDNEIVELIKSEGVVIGDRAYSDKDYISNTNLPSSYVKLSEDGKYIYYPQKITGYSFDLYRIPVGNKKAQGDTLVKGISSYTLLKNGQIIYIKNDKMYLYNPKNKDDKGEQLASNVGWMRVSEDEKQVLYRKTSDDNQKLCVRDLALKKDEEKLDTNVTSVVYTSEKLDRIIYKKDDVLYIMMNLKDKQKIASDVSQSFVCVDGKTTRYYYVKDNDEESISTMDFISDDLAAKDAEITEPNLSDYQHVEPVTSWWGTYDQTVTDYDAYYEARDAYYDKERRDSLRESWKEDSLAVQSQTIYEYLPDKDESNVVYEGYISNIESKSYSAFLYESMDLSDLDKIAFSKLIEEDMYSWYEPLSEHMDKALSDATSLNMVYNGKSVALNIDYEDLFEDGIVDNIRLRGTSDGTKQCYFNLTSYGEGDILFKTSLSKMDGVVEIVAEDVGNVVFVEDDGAYYVVEDEDLIGDLYFEGKEIDSDVNVSSLLRMKNDKGILYLTDTDDDHLVGTLKWYNGSKIVEISDDVSAYRSNGKGDIAFITDYNFNRYRGDLKVYTNNKVKDIDDDVTGILFYN